MTITISQKAIDFIIDQEDGSEAYYDKTEEHWDWPGGSSGPTVGVGYDCGYVSRDECRNDWTGIVDDHTVEKLMEGVGKTGAAAHVFVLNDRTGVTITYEQAVEQFRTRELPKWTNRTELALPNLGMLPGDCAGALVSISYNRGTGGYHSTLPRFREMREIFNLMSAANFDAIPDQIESMRRLWPRGGDLYDRRIAEAELFRDGLNSRTMEA